MFVLRIATPYFLCIAFNVYAIHPSAEAEGFLANFLVKSLKKAERNIGGIGGSINTYTIDDAVIVFKTEEGKLHKEELTLLVGVHSLDKLEEDERKLLTRLPSLLGRDILRNFKLVYNEKSDDVHMES